MQSVGPTIVTLPPGATRRAASPNVSSFSGEFLIRTSCADASGVKTHDPIARLLRQYYREAA